MERFSAVLANALDAVVAMDARGFITEWNAQAELIFRIKRADAIGRRMSETIIPHRYREAHERGLKRLLETHEGPMLGRRVELSALRGDGSEFPVELTVTALEEARTLTFYAFLRDITERKKIELERDTLLAELQEALDARDRFIAIASHELKNPVTSLMLNTQNAQRWLHANGHSLPAPIGRFVESTWRQTDRLSHLVEDLLDVSRISSGQLAIRREEFDLSQLVRDLLDQHAEQFRASGSWYRLTMDDSIVVTWDRYRIEQAITNLMSNAAKYGAGKRIALSVTREGDAVVIEIRDHGIGISADDQERLFHPFSRAKSAKTVGGLGLGLYITRQIAEAHGGTIQVVSAPNTGSTFTMTLPIRGETHPQPL